MQSKADGKAPTRVPRTVVEVDSLAYADGVNGENPLVWAASRLLDIMVQIRRIPQIDDVDGLRQQLIREIRAFEQRAQSEQVRHDELSCARYCLCTALDEIAAQMPWGNNGVWAKPSLLVFFHHEAWGGEKYYQMLTRITQNPEHYKDLIELQYYCIALGFEGRFKAIENGRSQLEALKQRIATVLGNVKGGYETRLSSHWQSMSSAPQPAWWLVPPWVISTLCGLIGFGVYVWLLFSLGSRSDVVYARLAALKIPEPAVMVAAKQPTGVAVQLRRFLEPEIREGLVEITESSRYCIVTLSGDGLFESGSANIRSRYLGVFKRVADALREINGNILVLGYTDDVPMRSLRFPSNWSLSQARAEMAKEMLDSLLGQAERIRAEGRGEADPIASNDTHEGRARNRRVEIAVLLSADAIHRQINPPR